MKKLTNRELFQDLSKTMAEELFRQYEYPWDILPHISEEIERLGRTLPEEEYIQTGDHIWIARSAVVAPTAYINGPTIIGPRTEVRHCAFIRGSALVGSDCVVGNSVELKNVILFDHVQTPHYNYVGDSILGYYAHMGAGSITSNVKSDKTPVTVNLDGIKTATERKKMGAILGDYVEVGCNSVLNPGTVIGSHASIYPLSMVRGYVPADSIYKNSGEVVEKQ